MTTVPLLLLLLLQLLLDDDDDEDEFDDRDDRDDRDSGLFRSSSRSRSLSLCGSTPPPVAPSPEPLRAFRAREGVVPQDTSTDAPLLPLLPSFGEPPPPPAAPPSVCPLSSRPSFVACRR